MNSVALDGKGAAHPGAERTGKKTKNNSEVPAWEGNWQAGE